MRMSIGAVGMVLVGTVTETPSKAPSLFMTLPPRERRALNCSSAWAASLLPPSWHPRPQGEGEREMRACNALDRDGHGRTVGDHRKDEQMGIFRHLDARRQGDVQGNSPLSPPAPRLVPGLRQTGWSRRCHAGQAAAWRTPWSAPPWCSGPSPAPAAATSPASGRGRSGNPLLQGHEGVDGAGLDVGRVLGNDRLQQLIRTGFLPVIIRAWA